MNKKKLTLGLFLKNDYQLSMNCKHSNANISLQVFLEQVESCGLIKVLVNTIS